MHKNVNDKPPSSCFVKMAIKRIKNKVFAKILVANLGNTDTRVANARKLGKENNVMSLSYLLI